MSTLHFLFFSTLISFTDLRTHRIRKRHVYYGFITLGPWFDNEVCVSVVVNFTLYLVIFLLSGRRLGFGDVRLSLLLGAYIGIWGSGASHILLSNAYAWMSALILVAGKCLIDRNSLKAHIPFAPHMFLGAAIAAFSQ